MADRRDRPDDNREDEAEAAADGIVDPARHHLAHAVQHQEGVLDGGVFGVRQVQVVADRRLQHRHRLAVDV